jgi:hypothetical protein
MSKQLDDYGFFGPSYSFADNIALPGQIGVRQEASFDAILDAIGGVNHYVDVIAFGSSTGFDSNPQVPLGVRYFLNSGMRCTNGASMSAYFDGVTKGDILGENVKEALASSGLPGLKGLAPGMLENARDALDPRPIFYAVTGTGYPVCQQVQCPVGTADGLIANPNDPNNTQPYILDPVQNVNGMPTQTRWVQAYDQDSSPISVTKAEFMATPKCYNADGTYMDNPPAGCPPAELAAVSQPGTDKYGLCTVVRTATMPPTVAPTTESFVGSADSEKWMTAAAIAVVGSAVVWGLCSK